MIEWGEIIMHSLKTKLIAGISALLLFLFGVTGALLVKEKYEELAQDIYFGTRSFTELATPKIVDLYRSLLAENSFFHFQRELIDVLRKTTDISGLRIYRFGGEVLFDSVEEATRQYDGEPRRIEIPDVLARIKANLPSFLLENGRIVYLKKTAEGEYLSVDENEQKVDAIAPSERIATIMYPIGGEFAVAYDVSYANLRARVFRMTERIVLLLLFGLLVGLGAASYVSTRITRPVATLKEGALKLGAGDFSVRVPIVTKDEIGLLSETFNTMAKDLEISTQEKVEREHLRRELALAAKIQQQIIPKSLPTIEGLELATALIPAAEIGGDCYDFIQVDPQTHLIYISDVTGHGIPSGLVVSVASALLYSYSDLPDTRQILLKANSVMKKKTSQNMFMTLLMLRYAAGKISYVSAGHPEMLHYFGVERKVAVEKGGGIALGMVPDPSKLLVEHSIAFNSGDVVVLYSDGIPECVNEKGELYGMPRFKRALQDAGEIASAEAIKNALVADVKLFAGKAEQADDITLVVIRKK